MNPYLKAILDNPTIVATGLVSFAAALLLNKIIPMVGSASRWILKVLAARAGGTLKQREFRRHYLSWVISTHRQIRLSGFSGTRRPTLDEVFIPVRLKSPETEHVTSAPRRNNKKMSPLRQTVSEKFDVLFKLFYLLCWAEIRVGRNGPVFKAFNDELFTKLTGFVRILLGMGPRSRDERQHLLNDIGHLGRFVAIVGPTGVGKTAILQFLALVHARRVGRYETSREVRNLRLPGNRALFPIYVSLADFARQQASRKLGEGSVVSYLVRGFPEEVRKWYPGDYLDALLHGGRCIVLLDGLDEVFDSRDYRRVKTALEGFIARFPRNHYVLSSRPSGWRDGIGADFVTAEVQDLTPKAIRQFVSNWYAFRYPNIDPGDRTSSLIRQIHEDDRLAKLARRAMLLTILTTVHDSSPTIGSLEHGALYRRCAEVLLYRRDDEKGIGDTTGLRTTQKHRVLQRLAWALHTGEIGAKHGGRGASKHEVVHIIEHSVRGFSLKVSPEALLNYFVDRTELLMSVDMKTIGFSHMSFQEYFCAEYINSTIGIRPFLEQHQGLDREWQDVAVILAGLAEDPIPLVEQVYMVDPGDPFKEYLSQACRLVTEARLGPDVPIVDRILRECLSLLTLGEAKPPPKFPVALAEYVLIAIDGILGDLIRLRDYVMSDSSSVDSLLEKVTTVTPRRRASALRVLSLVELTPGHVNQVARFLTDSSDLVWREAARLLDRVPYQLDRQAWTHVSAKAQSLLSSDDVDLQNLIPLIVKNWTDDSGLSASLNSALKESPQVSTLAGFLLGAVTERGILTFHQIGQTGLRGNFPSVYERVFMAAGAIYAGKVTDGEVDALVKRCGEQPGWVRAQSPVLLHLLAFGKADECVPVIAEHLFRKGFRYPAVMSLVSVGHKYIPPEVAFQLRALVMEETGTRRARVKKCKTSICIAAQLFAASRHASSEDAVILCHNAPYPIVRSFLSEIHPEQYAGSLHRIVAALRNAPRSQEDTDTLEWFFVEALRSSNWWTDSTGESQQILEDYLFDLRWYISASAAEGWYLSTGRKVMPNHILDRMYDLLSDTRLSGTPPDVNQRFSPQEAAFHSLAREATLRGGNWPTASDHDEPGSLSRHMH